MNLIINDITILSELVGTINKADLDFMDITFHTIPMAIDKSQQSAAKDLKEADVLACHTLDQEEDTLWIAEHLSCDVGFGDLSIIRLFINLRFLPTILFSRTRLVAWESKWWM